MILAEGLLVAPKTELNRADAPLADTTGMDAAPATRAPFKAVTLRSGEPPGISSSSGSRSFAGYSSGSRPIGTNAMLSTSDKEVVAPEMGTARPRSNR